MKTSKRSLEMGGFNIPSWIPEGLEVFACEPQSQADVEWIYESHKRLRQRVGERNYNLMCLILKGVPWEQAVKELEVPEKESSNNLLWEALLFRFRIEAQLLEDRLQKKCNLVRYVSKFGQAEPD